MFDASMAFADVSIAVANPSMAFRPSTIASALFSIVFRLSTMPYVTLLDTVLLVR